MQSLTRSAPSLRSLRSLPHVAGRPLTSSAAAPVAAPEEDAPLDDLASKASGANVRAAFASRACAALRYDYFAQRAELEAELEAASTFRSLKAVAEQQALGFLELLEEHGSPTAEGGAVIGTTIDNVATGALGERGEAEVFNAFAAEAGGEGLERVQEWMEDMGSASERVADRLELISGLMDEEFGEFEDEDAAEGGDAEGAEKKK